MKLDEARAGLRRARRQIYRRGAVMPFVSTEIARFVRPLRRVFEKSDEADISAGNAAISMTYITGQPIVFVGTGQTYTDLKALNSKAVVQALMK